MTENGKKKWISSSLNVYFKGTFMEPLSWYALCARACALWYMKWYDRSIVSICNNSWCNVSVCNSSKISNNSGLFNGNLFNGSMCNISKCNRRWCNSNLSNVRI